MIATVVLILRFLLSIALYSFLGWALLTLWRDLKQQGVVLSSQKKTGVTITVKADQGRERQTHFSQSEIIIGRHAHCDLSILDESLSSQHTRITYHHGQWWLEDLNSTNGTFLNREKLTTPAVIITDDEFRCGNTLFTVRIDLDENPSPTKRT
ncbi:MAG TPA: FHA domain-containing protein [Anaerolineales bacterium]|nr:FHA domain-containing protein [Anaerolineales bacterium]